MDSNDFLGLGYDRSGSCGGHVEEPTFAHSSGTLLEVRGIESDDFLPFPGRDLTGLLPYRSGICGGRVGKSTFAHCFPIFWRC